MNVEAVVFDWGGTLTPWHAIDLLDPWLAYARAVGAGEDLARSLLAQEELAWVRARDHQRSGTLTDLFHAAGIDPCGAAHTAGMAAYEDVWEPHTWTDPDAAPLLAALRARGLKVGVLSNTLWTRDYHEKVLARDGVLHLVDAAVFSSEIAWTKPHPEAFDAVRTAVGVTEPGACVFVGDRPFDDIHGAAEAGMRTVLIPHSAIPDHQHGHTLGTPDAVVQRLGDVLGVVEAWG